MRRRWWPVLGMALGAAAPAPALRVAVPASEMAGARTLAQDLLVGFTRATGRAVRLVALPAQGWDVARLDPAALAAACASGRVRHLEWARLGGRDHWRVGASDCGAGAEVAALALSWDAAKLRGVTPDWAAFWDVARAPGRRGLPRTPVGALEIALMADGVAARDVYAVLRGQEGQDRAFRKLDQLRPYLVWWHSEAQAVAMLGSGQVLMIAAPARRVLAAPHRRFAVQWTGAVDSVPSWAIAADTTAPDAAYALIGRARGEPPDAAHLAAGLVLDGGFWRDHGAALNARFDAWLAP